MVNNTKRAVTATLDFGKIMNMKISGADAVVEKRVEPESIAFMMHCQAVPSAAEFSPQVSLSYV